MDCFLVVSTNAFKTTDGSAVEMSDFYEELDYRLNRISGPSFLWYVEYIKDEEIHIYYRHSGPITRDEFDTLIKEGVLPIFKSLKVKGTSFVYNESAELKIHIWAHQAPNPCTEVPSGYIGGR